MHILICNERFLFRFGLDRTLILFGRGLKSAGHRISIMANKYDGDVLREFASDVIEVPMPRTDHLNSNEFTENWLNDTWDRHFTEANKPDIVLIGGWPFFTSISLFRRKGIPVVFLDCGAVPLMGYTGGALITQKKLRELRQHFLPEATAIIAISQFIADSQSIADTQSKIPVFTNLLGADHMDMNIWQEHNEHKTEDIIKKVVAIKQEGKYCILNLGRWEPHCYKNSESIFDILRAVRRKIPHCVLLVLGKPSEIQIPNDLSDIICPIGFPTDAELKYLMNNADLGVSTSLWEGFNLPLAEMQWLKKPVLVFNTGAHPEVVIHPWHLCTDNEEMADKAIKILQGRDLDRETKETALQKFHASFTWNSSITGLANILQNVSINNCQRSLPNAAIIVDVTNATRDTANSGVIRVTRRICHEFQKYVHELFVVWDGERDQYVFPTKAEFHQLNQFNGPVFKEDCILSSNTGRLTLTEYLEKNPATKRWLIFTETLAENRANLIRRFARENDISLAAIFYDAIPVLYPDLCKDITVRNNHNSYMAGLAECDIIIPISGYSAECLENFWRTQEIKGCPVVSDLLPGEFGGFPRNITMRTPNLKDIRILCVSTLEPRKNHKTLIDACLLLQNEHPEVNWTLTLVGNRYAGAFEIADEIQQISKENPRIQWAGVIPDTTLHRLYDEATFTVYPSIIEGFGMPILESIWHGKPVICSDHGVMSELAADGGCLTTDILDRKSLSDSIYRLCTDTSLILKLSQESVKRPIKSWDEYTRQFLSILGRQDITKTSFSVSNDIACNKNIPTWEERLYPHCLCENWQMNHSERMALTALLMRHKPQCSIEIGTYKGGSLSLIYQLSRCVYSLDIDPSIPEKFGYFKNVTFLTGSSTISLPLLLKALDSEGVPVDFILIDGDHSAEGIKRDLNSVLAYVPKRPLFVMLHDSFNPECRRGMLEASWDTSPYVQWVDLDFVPGRIVENGSSSDGEQWGGLALAYLTPTIRDKSLAIDQTANRMYEFTKKFSERKIGK